MRINSSCILCRSIYSYIAPFFYSAHSWSTKSVFVHSPVYAHTNGRPLSCKAHDFPGLIGAYADLSGPQKWRSDLPGTPPIWVGLITANNPLQCRRASGWRKRFSKTVMTPSKKKKKKIVREPFSQSAVRVAPSEAEVGGFIMTVWTLKWNLVLHQLGATQWH